MPATEPSQDRPGSLLLPALLVVAGLLVTAGLVGAVVLLNGGGDDATADPGRVTPSSAGAAQLLRLEDCPATDPDAESVAGGLPDVTLDCLGAGDAVRLASLTGQPTVLNIWAQWCGPCRKELPLIERAHDEFGDQLRVVGINYEESDDQAALDLLADSGVTYPQVADPHGSIRGSLGLQGLPMTVFVDADGAVVYAINSELESYDQLSGLIEAKLGVSPN